MISLNLELDNRIGRTRQAINVGRQRMEFVGLIATDRAATEARRRLRSGFQQARLGRLGNAFGATSDLKRTGRVFQRGAGFSASGSVVIRSRSERTLGAIESYTRGSTIVPVTTRYLWIPTDAVQRLVGSGADRRRLTPALWNARGLNQRIGELTFVRSINGNPLLVLNNVGVGLAGRRRARSLTRSGRPRRGDVERQFVVAFVGILRTSRQARVNPRRIGADVQRLMPEYARQAYLRTFR